jgi:hypothetical protein
MAGVAMTGWLAPSRRYSGGVYRSLPTWLQWALPFGIAAVVVIGVVVFVEHQTNDVPQYSNTDKNSIVEQNREDSTLVRQQQAPREARLATGQSAVSGLRVAVVRYMNYEINHGVMDGPVVSSSCHAVPGAADGARLALKCNVKAADVTYPFLGVVQPSVKRITYCQRVAPPVPSMNIPVSSRCT